MMEESEKLLIKLLGENFQKPAKITLKGKKTPVFDTSDRENLICNILEACYARPRQLAQPQGSSGLCPFFPT